MRFGFTDDVGLIADGLVIDQGAVLDQIPALGLDAFIVVTDGAERVRLDLVGEQGDPVAAVLEFVLQFVDGGEAGTGIVGFITEDAVEFERMSDVFVDGQPQMGGIEHQIVLAGLDRGRFQFQLGLLGGGNGVFLHVEAVVVGEQAVRQDDVAVTVEVFVAHAHRRRQAVAAAEFAGGLVDGGDREGRPDPVHVLVDVGTVGGREIFLLVDQEQHGVDEIGAGGHGRTVGGKQQIDLVLDRHFHRVFLDRRGPGHFADALDRCQLYRLGL